MVRAEVVDEQNRVARARGWGHVDVGDVHAIRVEKLHGKSS